MSPQPVVPTAHRPRRSPRPSQACPCQRTRRPPPLLLILFPFLASLFAVVASPTTFPWSLPFLVSLSKPFALPLPGFARSPIPCTANLTPFVVSRIPFVLKLIPFVVGLSNHDAPRRPRNLTATPRPTSVPSAASLPQTRLAASIQTSVLNAPQNPPNRTPAQPKSFLEKTLTRAHAPRFRPSAPRHLAQLALSRSPLRASLSNALRASLSNHQPPHPKRRRISHPPARNTPKGFRAGGCEYPQKATAITCANRQSARPSPHGTHPRH